MVRVCVSTKNISPLKVLDEFIHRNKISFYLQLTKYTLQRDKKLNGPVNN